MGIFTCAIEVAALLPLPAWVPFETITTMAKLVIRPTSADTELGSGALAKVKPVPRRLPV